MTSNAVNYDRNVRDDKNKTADRAETQRSNRANESNTRRGQDVSAQTTRRGQDINADVTRRGQNIKAGTDTLSAITRMFNDPAWYNRDKQLTEDVARISFNNPLGAPVSAPIRMSDNTPFSRVAFAGVMGLDFIPTVGNAFGGTNNTINVAARNIYAFVRHANAGSSNYDSTDYMLYLISAASIYAGVAHLAKIYSLALTAKGRNYYYPDAMLQACHVPSNYFAANSLANFRYRLNMLITKLNSLYVPNTLTLFQRWIWLASNIFKDAEIKKSQEYIFSPALIWEYDEIHTILKPKYLYAGGPIAESWEASSTDGPLGMLNTLEVAFNKLVTSESIGIMSGDTLKAFGEDKLFRFSTLPDDFHIESIFSDEVLSQINSANVSYPLSLTTFIGEPATTDATTPPNISAIYFPGELPESGKLTPTATQYICTSVTGTAAVPVLQGHLVNMYKDDPTSDDVMVATRLATEYDVTTIGSTRFMYVKNCGSEYISKAAIFYGKPDALLAKYDVMPSGVLTANTPATTVYLATCSRYFQFDWAPQIWIVANKASVFPNQFGANQAIPMFDVQNYAYIATDALESMHNVAVLSELAIPMLGDKNYSSKK